MKNDTIIEPEWDIDKKGSSIPPWEEQSTAQGRDMSDSEQVQDFVELAEKERDVARGGINEPKPEGSVEGERKANIKVDEAQDEEPDPFTEPEKIPPSRFKQFIGSFLSGNILSKAEVQKHYVYILFLAFLALIYISNVFRMQYLHRQHQRLTIEVKELRAKSMTFGSIRMDATRQSSIIKEMDARGMDLTESLVPPKVIEK